jgi:polyhydroxyalkanoate synthase
MAEQASTTKPGEAPSSLPPLEEMQHWTGVMGRAQQMMMEHVAKAMGETPAGNEGPPQWPAMAMFPDPAALARQQIDLWTEGLSIWQRALGAPVKEGELAAKADQDKRFNAPQWRDNPVFDMIRQSYVLISDRLLGSVDALDGVDDKNREKLRFATRAFVDAMSPSNFAVTNPLVLEKTLEKMLVGRKGRF